MTNISFIFYYFYCRAATGENWQMIMLDCMSGAMCDPLSSHKETPNCGTDMAVGYFVSFVFLCSFLVRTLIYLNLL